MRRSEKLLPALRWMRGYDGETFSSDLIAAIIVTIMLIPQSLAYALLAGLPAEVGLYASILPLAVYALFGSSSTLSVGPVAIASLMTAAAVGEVSAGGDVSVTAAAITLAALSGGMLAAFGFLRLGFLATPFALGAFASVEFFNALDRCRRNSFSAVGKGTRRRTFYDARVEPLPRTATQQSRACICGNRYYRSSRIVRTRKQWRCSSRFNSYRPA